MFEIWIDTAEQADPYYRHENGIEIQIIQKVPRQLDQHFLPVGIKMIGQHEQNEQEIDPAHPPGMTGGVKIEQAAQKGKKGGNFK